MATKINGESMIEPLGNSASESLPWGDIIAVNRACDLWLRQRGLSSPKFNGVRFSREELERRRARGPRDASGGTPELRRLTREELAKTPSPSLAHAPNLSAKGLDQEQDYEQEQDGKEQLE